MKEIIKNQHRLSKINHPKTRIDYYSMSSKNWVIPHYCKKCTTCHYLFAHNSSQKKKTILINLFRKLVLGWLESYFYFNF